MREKSDQAAESGCRATTKVAARLAMSASPLIDSSSVSDRTPVAISSSLCNHTHVLSLPGSDHSSGAESCRVTVALNSGCVLCGRGWVQRGGGGAWTPAVTNKGSATARRHLWHGIMSMKRPCVAPRTLPPRALTENYSARSAQALDLERALEVKRRRMLQYWTNLFRLCTYSNIP